MSFFHRGWCHHKFQAIWFNSCQKNFVLTDCIFSFGFITFVICFRARMTQLIGTTVLFDLSVWEKKTESWRKLLQEYILWNVSKYGVFSVPYFPAFGLNTERYAVSLRIQSECGKIRTRKNSLFGHFWRSDNYLKTRKVEIKISFQHMNLVVSYMKIDIIKKRCVSIRYDRSRRVGTDTIKPIDTWAVAPFIACNIYSSVWNAIL